MREVQGNIQSIYDDNPGHIIGIPTNGSLDENKMIIINDPTSFEALNRFPDLKQELTNRFKRYGNNVIYFKLLRILTFPIKQKHDMDVDVNVVTKSCVQLNDIAKKLNKTVIIPKFDCSDQEASIKPILESKLSNQIILVL